MNSSTLAWRGLALSLLALFAAGCSCSNPNTVTCPKGQSACGTCA